jgi:hypothetical protein
LEPSYNLEPLSPAGGRFAIGISPSWARSALAELDEELSVEFRITKDRN